MDNKKLDPKDFNPHGLYAGQIINFDKRLPSLLDWAKFLCEADEMAKAMDLLTNYLPGYYRHHQPKEVVELKKLIMKQYMTTMDYAANDKDCEIFDEGKTMQAIDNTLRGRAITALVESYNKSNLTPHVIDMGPGEYWVPMGLNAKNLKFTYEPLGLNKAVESKAKEVVGHVFHKGPVSDRPVIFIACEIIEHLWNPWEIGQTAMRVSDRIDLIVMSTPLFTFGFGNQTWTEPQHTGYIGHIKTYTPDEFLKQAVDNFPDFDFELTVSEVMLLIGKKKI